MDYRFRNQSRRKNFMMLQGTITDIQAAGNGGRGGGCSQFVTMELEDGSIVNFVVTADTYVVNYDNLSVGMEVMFFYDADAPMILIYPPQYQAVAVAQVTPGQNVTVSFFDRNLVSSDGRLQLNLDRNVPVRTVNNQTFTGNPANRYLLAVYDRTTRSIPAQTTPQLVVVLCNA